MITADLEILFARYVVPHLYYHSQYRLSPVSGRVICSLALRDDGWVIYDVLEQFTHLAKKPLRAHSIRCDNNEERERHVEKAFLLEKKCLFCYFSTLSDIFKFVVLPSQDKNIYSEME